MYSIISCLIKTASALFVLQLGKKHKSGANSVAAVEPGIGIWGGDIGVAACGTGLIEG